MPANEGEQKKEKHSFFGELPLQNETNFFILANTLDIFMTYVLLRNGAMEANPLANYVLQNWGFNGMIFFKLGIVAFVCVIAQLIALKKIQTARWLLIATSVLVGLVVVYSACLFLKHFY